MAAQTSTREGKTALIGEVKENFGKSTSVVFVDYKGLTVDKVTKLRAKFRAAGVEYKVVKNTLVKQAIKDEAWASKLDKTLTGMTGVAYSFEDPSAAAKVLKEFKKDQGDAGQKLVVKAGILDGLDATTHWYAYDELASYGARPTEQRVVQQGKVWTAAGVSAGIDLALTLVAEVWGPEVSQAIQLGIEYDPQPPYDSGAPSKADRKSVV